MTKILALGLLAYLLYRLLVPRPRPAAPSAERGPEAADDVLVLDPVCQTYIAQQGADSYRHHTTTYYFCSPECREKFKLQLRSQEK